MFQTFRVTIGTLFLISSGLSNFVRNEDICGANNGRRLYLELGERGILYGKNVSFVKNVPRQEASRSYVTNSSHNQCSLELVSCPSCVITVTFKHLELPHHCADGSITLDSPCRCDYVWITEPPYEDVSGTPFCGLYVPLTYRSSTRTLSITLLYSKSHKHAFAIEYTAERNRLHLKGPDMVSGVAKSMNTTGGGILTSPFFPSRYPRDLGMEYVISCASEAISCRVRVLFSDFQLATVSIVEFYDWNGQRLDVSSGARFRPPVIVSSGPSLVIRFYANGGTGLGYKAFYSFVIGNLYDKSVQPITDCGGYVENLGGAITMMDMVGQGLKTYDCVWLIRPPKNFLHMKTHMYLKVVDFADMAGNTELTIKQGPTSALSPLEVLRHPASQLQPLRRMEHVAPVASGFHVSLRGTFGPTSRLAIAYAAFSYTDCFSGSDFLCQNHRCIPSQLNCDGFDHCSDDSDEPATCFQNWELEPQDRKWHVNKANYYFPKIDRYPDLKTATLVFVASSLGLIVLISALIVLLYRMGARARQQRELQSRLQTISELLDGARIDEVAVSDDPPVYEAPPGYDEVVKVGLANEVSRRKRKKSSCRESRSANVSVDPSVDLETPTTSLLLDTDPNVVQTGQRNTMLPETTRIPESPPPAYITPPETVSRNLNIPIAISQALNAGTRYSTRQSSRARCAWIRNTYASASVTPTHQNVVRSASATPMDAEALGAYLRSYIADITQNSALQQFSSPDVSKDTSRNCAVRSGEPEGASGGNVANCACQGACGCATSGDDESPEDGSTTDMAATNAAYDNGQCSTKDSIIKLLGTCNVMIKPAGGTSLNSTTISASTSSNFGYRTAMGRINTSSFLIPSPNFTPFVSPSTVAASGAGRMRVGLDVHGETANGGERMNYNDALDTAIRGSRRARQLPARSRSCTTCDLESLYEGMKILDSFLADRGIPVRLRKNRSTETLYAMDAEYFSTNVAAAATTAHRTNSGYRNWRSADDTLIK